uniref:OrfB n=1 Tax=Halorubrum saccharovorum TaxID=2248 RepID=Q8J301_9EURY|nr:orfB [Halorubrum saccharovorum]
MRGVESFAVILGQHPVRGTSIPRTFPRRERRGRPSDAVCAVVPIILKTSSQSRDQRPKRPGVGEERTGTDEGTEKQRPVRERVQHADEERASRLRRLFPVLLVSFGPREITGVRRLVLLVNVRTGRILEGRATHVVVAGSLDCGPLTSVCEFLSVEPTRPTVEFRREASKPLPRRHLLPLLISPRTHEPPREASSSSPLRSTFAQT